MAAVRHKTRVVSRLATVANPTPGAPLSAVAPQGAVQQSKALSDSFGRFHDYLRISITERCNLRCQYCMPKEGIDLTPDPELMTTEEIVRAASLFTSLGVKKIRLTGGEPLVRRDFDFLASKLGALRSSGLEKLCITTNGINLYKKIPVLKQHHVNYINISLDTLEDHKYQFVTRRNGYEKVMRALHACIDEPQFVTKVNCVVMGGVNDDEVAKFAELARDYPIEVRFIEYMPFGGNDYQQKLLVPWMQTFDDIERGMGCKLAPMQGKRGDVSKRFSAAGWKGCIGFITTMTSKFCSSCNRMRLLADGQLKVCLFDSNEGTLLKPMREGATDDDLTSLVASMVVKKQEALGGHTEETLASHSDENRPMIKIGG
eukprot:TRINITY_DN10701_c1_g1_i1.p1 TRINITY_DN10701_c1_g1~~TRINITY_DN10701_c1_g1_i1.p1  ORF type:complete len:373 (+),score=147.80 TRINITY_DN10701_c1_g1_i1:93-1211(+)